MSDPSTEATSFSWLLGNFVKSVPGVQHTLVVSADGLLMAMSDGVERTQGEVGKRLEPLKIHAVPAGSQFAPPGSRISQPKLPSAPGSAPAIRVTATTPPPGGTVAGLSNIRASTWTLASLA